MWTSCHRKNRKRPGSRAVEMEEKEENIIMAPSKSPRTCTHAVLVVLQACPQAYYLQPRMRGKAQAQGKIVWGKTRHVQ